MTQQLVGQAAATYRITYAEARAALARREREAPLLTGEWAEARRRLDADWAGFGVVEVTAPLAEQAANFAETFALRAYDATQLAACHALRTTLPGQVTFFSYDIRLNRAARLLGVQLPPGAQL